MNFYKIFNLNILVFCFCIFNNVLCLEHENIINGYYTEDKQFTYQIVLYRGQADACGGGIISDYHVLVAAHCVIGPDDEFYKVKYTVVGGIRDLKDMSKNRIERSVKRIYVPNTYKRNGHFDDIAVIELSNSLELKNNKRLSKLDLPGSWLEYAGRTAELAGFGWNWIKIEKDPKTNEEKEIGGNHNTALKYIKATIIKNIECTQTNSNELITPKILCAKTQQLPGVPEQGVCSGDSGGPLVYKNTVVGILTASPFGCDESIRAAKYAKVSKFLDFIENSMKNKIRLDMRILEMPDLHITTNEVR